MPATRRKPTSLPPVPNRQAVVDAAQLVLGHPLDPARPMRYLRQFSDIYLAAAHETLRDECTRCGDVRNSLSDPTDRRDALHDIRVYAGRSAAVTRELRRRGVIS